MTRLFPYSCLTVAMILVGSSVVAGEIMIRHFPIHLGSLLRFTLASAIIAPIWLLKEGGLPRLHPRSWLILVGQTLCGSVLFTIFVLYGLRWTSPASAGIITSTTPACMGLLAWIILGERPGGRVLAGIVISVAGIAVLNLSGARGDGAGSWAGNLFVAAAVVVESLFLLVRKSIRDQLSPLAVSSLITLLATLFFMPLGLWQAANFSFAGLPLEAWWCVLYYAVPVTIIAYLCWFAGVTRVPAGVAGIFTGVLPVSALLISALFLGQAVTRAQLFGCGLAMLSIVLISGRNSG